MFQFQRGQEQLNVLSSEHLRDKAIGGKRERRKRKSEIFKRKLQREEEEPQRWGELARRQTCGIRNPKRERSSRTSF
jgi:hypothetical protein